VTGKQKGPAAPTASPGTNALKPFYLDTCEDTTFTREQLHDESFLEWLSTHHGGRAYLDAGAFRKLANRDLSGAVVFQTIARLQSRGVLDAHQRGSITVVSVQRGPAAALLWKGWRQPERANSMPLPWFTGGSSGRDRRWPTKGVPSWTH
jgi:hypothetical protein